MDANLVFFWVLFGPLCALVVVGVVGALAMLVGALIQGASDGLLGIIRRWRTELHR